MEESSPESTDALALPQDVRSPPVDEAKTVSEGKKRKRATAMGSFFFLDNFS